MIHHTTYFILVFATSVSVGR